MLLSAAPLRSGLAMDAVIRLAAAIDSTLNFVYNVAIFRDARVFSMFTSDIINCGNITRMLIAQHAYTPLGPTAIRMEDVVGNVLKLLVTYDTEFIEQNTLDYDIYISGVATPILGATLPIVNNMFGANSTEIMHNKNDVALPDNDWGATLFGVFQMNSIGRLTELPKKDQAKIFHLLYYLLEFVEALANQHVINNAGKMTPTGYRLWVTRIARRVLGLNN